MISAEHFPQRKTVDLDDNDLPITGIRYMQAIGWLSMLKMSGFDSKT